MGFILGCCFLVIAISGLSYYYNTNPYGLFFGEQNAELKAQEEEFLETIIPTDGASTGALGDLESSFYDVRDDEDMEQQDSTSELSLNSDYKDGKRLFPDKSCQGFVDQRISPQNYEKSHIFSDAYQDSHAQQIPQQRDYKPHISSDASQDSHIQQILPQSDEEQSSSATKAFGDNSNFQKKCHDNNSSPKYNQRSEEHHDSSYAEKEIRETTSKELTDLPLESTVYSSEIRRNSKEPKSKRLKRYFCGFYKRLKSGNKNGGVKPTKENITRKNPTYSTKKPPEEDSRSERSIMRNS